MLTPRRPIRVLSLVLGLGLPAAAFAPPLDAAAGRPPEPSTTTSVGLDLAGIDRSVPPGADFFAYANGAWLKTTAIPPDRATYGVDAMAAERTGRRTRELIEEAAKAKAAAGSETRKIGDYYTAFLDEAGIESRGLAPLKPIFERIEAIADRRALARFLGTTLRADVDILNSTKLYTDNLFGLWIAQDLDDPGRYVPFLLQGGLDMPDRAYYLEGSPRMEEIRAAYRRHVEAVFTRAGLGPAPARAERVVALERKIAETHASRDDTDVQKGNNHWPRERFDTAAPGL